MKKADRLNKLEMSKIRMTSKLMDQLEAEGRDIIRFTYGEPNFDTPKYIKDACTDALYNGHTKYSDYNGPIHFRQAVCDKYERENGLKFDPIQVISTCGAAQAAYLVLTSFINDGDEVLIPDPMYGIYKNITTICGGTPVAYSLKEENDFQIDLEQMKNLITDKTKVVFGEVIGNPGLDVIDLKAVSEFVHSKGIPLIVDSTTATPYLVQPIAYGADVVVHSSSKYINGGGNAISGVIVDSGKFSWDNKRYPGFAEYQKYGEFAYVAKLRNGIWRNMGGCLAPMNAFLNFVGMDTLGLRMDKICSNALELAKAVDGLNGVTANYPALENNPYKPLVESQLNGMGGGILTLRVGSKERAYQLMNHLQRISVMHERW